ncbi:MAG: D-2-hydroxyacid dehydrogenase [Flavobacteriales bacterium]
MKVLANDGISEDGKKKLEEAGFEVNTEKVSQDELANAINENEYVALLVRSATKVRKELIDQCPGLKFIGRGGVGLDNIDVEHAESKGITVVNTPAAPSQSVAELIMGHLFNVARFIHDANKQMPEKGVDEFKTLKKKYAKGAELRGKTLGVVGFGRIGQYTAKYALGCGMKVIYHDPFVENANINLEIEGADNVEVKLTSTSFDDVITNSDFISLNVPKQKDGSAVVGDNEINKMKEGVALINASRGGVIDEGALLKALDSGKVGHVALDVFENEPTPKKELLQHEKVSLTPHIGASTVEAQNRIGVELADKIIEVLDAKPVGS